MAEYVLSVVEGVIANVMSLAVELIESVRVFKDELNTLLDSSTKIQALLRAEKRQKNDIVMSIWLLKLKDVESLNPIPKISLDWKTDSFIDGSEVVGRGDDVLEIVNLLIGAKNQQDIPVIPIVGMAGLGRTITAKLVYNHELVKKHFDVRMWVCVSEDFDVERILREILEVLNNCSIGLENKNAILYHLQKKLKGKRYLLILDDVWIENSEKWDSLRRSLLGINQNHGNNIIVTTRSDNVAQIMETSLRHKLEKLSEDECWLLFKKKAFANERIPLDLEAIGREIAKRLGRNPLVASVLGGMM
ncbi:putative disease resistance protein RGA3 [Quercus lobata]|uniref:putative disease resistance protein RGA3 n=1 Tax=Quercus lobata TaxID=97700 RepID=UPI001248F50D|nr:putative disease resistance protein RGA3 [Quercus lobata]